MNLNAKGKTHLSESYCHPGVKQRAPHSQAALVRRAWEKEGPSVSINMRQGSPAVHRGNHRDKALPRNKTGTCAHLWKQDAVQTSNAIANSFLTFISLAVFQISDSFPTFIKKGRGWKFLFFLPCLSPTHSFSQISSELINMSRRSEKNSLHLRACCLSRTLVPIWNPIQHMSLYKQIRRIAQLEPIFNIVHR